MKAYDDKYYSSIEGLADKYLRLNQEICDSTIEAAKTAGQLERSIRWAKIGVCCAVAAVVLNTAAVGLKLYSSYNMKSATPKIEYQQEGGLESTIEYQK